MHMVKLLFMERILKPGKIFSLRKYNVVWSCLNSLWRGPTITDTTHWGILEAGRKVRVNGQLGVDAAYEFPGSPASWHVISGGKK